MNIIKDMNESQFENSPIVYGGAINQTRRNLDVEISRVRKKMDAGATFFLTQPVFDDKGIARLMADKAGNRCKDSLWNNAICKPEKCHVYEK